MVLATPLLMATDDKEYTQIDSHHQDERQCEQGEQVVPEREAQEE